MIRESLLALGFAAMAIASGTEKKRAETAGYKVVGSNHDYEIRKYYSGEMSSVLMPSAGAHSPNLDACLGGHQPVTLAVQC